MKQINSGIQQRSIWRFSLLFAVISLLLSSELSAQEKTVRAARKDSIKGGKTAEGKGFSSKIKVRSARKDSIKAIKIAEGKGIFSVLGGPGYTPELKLILAVGTLYSFKTDKQDELIQRSTVNSSLGVTSSGGIIFKSILTSFWKEDKVRINANLFLKDVPDHYWGVGYDEGLNTPKSDSTTAYNRFWWQVNPTFLYRLKENFYVGPVFDFNQTIAKNESQGVLDDTYYQQFGPNNYNGGAGIVLQHDSRDIPVNAYHGTLVQLQTIFYGGWLGGVNNYQLLDIDFRKYHQLGKIDGQTLAWNIRGRFTFGEVPYAELSQLGSPMDLRGYTWGRFRDKSMVYGIAEYRHMFMKRSSDERGKHGIVGWLAAGTIMSDVSDIDEWLPNIGVGYRLEVQPRMNVRFDLGAGRDNVGFYFNFTEAF